MEQTRVYSITSRLPASIRAAVYVNDAEAMVTIAVRTEVATATGILFRFTSYGRITSLTPTPRKPTRNDPKMVKKAPIDPVSCFL